MSTNVSPKAEENNNIYLPIMIITMVVGIVLFGHLIDQPIKAHLYALSMAIQNILVAILPFIIFSFLFHSIRNIGKDSLSFIIFIMIGVCLSNFFSTILAYCIGSIFISESVVSNIQAHNSNTLEPAWNFSFSQLFADIGLSPLYEILSYISNDVALFAGVVLGMISAYINSGIGKKIGDKMLEISLFILNKLFIPIMPVFIAGFILKMQHEQVLQFIISNYFKVFIILFITLYGYLGSVYFILSNFNFLKFGKYIKNIVPAMITGFCTMSSAVSLPLLLKGVENNTKHPAFTRVTVPSIVNIHLVGDCFAINIMAIAMMLSYGMPFPSISLYLIFATYFVIAKFAVAAVPGGGIIVMIPILIKYLGFSSEMVSLITVLYIIFDPLITSANITGNSAFSIILLRIYRLIDYGKDKLKEV